MMPVVRILAVSDEVDEALYGEKLYKLRPDLVISCGDLPFEFMENLVSRLDVPLAYVPGNHDPDLNPPPINVAPLAHEPPPGPQGCDNVDGRILNAAGLRIAGLGGSTRYNLGPNQYTQGEMRFRAVSLEMRVRMRQALSNHGLDVLVTHAAPLGLGDEHDPAHRGFAAFHRLITKLAPKLVLHGHVHGGGTPRGDRRLGDTLIVNAIPFRLLEI